jgi:aminopeptidase N
MQQESFNQLIVEAINRVRLGQKLCLHTRYFVQLGTPSPHPPESQLYLSGASPEQMYDNKYVRSRLFGAQQNYMSDLPRTVDMHYGGGLNLRGFAGYSPTVERMQEVYYSDIDTTITMNTTQYLHSGNNGMAGNVELEFGKLIGFKQGGNIQVQTYAFADAGIISQQHIDRVEVHGTQATPMQATRLYSDVLWNIGLGSTVKFRFPLNVRPLTLRFDVPLLYSHAINSTGSRFAPRLLIGVNRTF